MLLGLSDSELRGVLDVLVGYPDDRTFYLGLLLLSPEARGHATGRAVYAAFERWAVSLGAERVELGVVRENVRALAFWERQGFQVFDVTPPKTFGVKTHEVLKLDRWLRR
ncbi:GNAT family N-acetyltransferase [Deinococcus pimensis]|uniref:GNAT family N-acetyltransferase n=1 Tax=Deinococcus pimensis TaxID=309888 RepID=UPI0004B52698|nr:GNAT family N-acetyltransferase [Deinococcus pimensis]